MTIRLTPDQEKLVQEAVSSGLAPSAEDFVSQALRNERDELARDADLEHWLRTEVVQGHEEYMRDPSTGVPVGEVMAAIKARRAAKN